MENGVFEGESHREFKGSQEPPLWLMGCWTLPWLPDVTLSLKCTGAVGAVGGPIWGLV